MKLNELCEIMYSEGYRFASLSENPPVMCDMEDDTKPAPAWYFSEIVWGEECSLSWAEWCKYEKFYVGLYSAKPICFAKFDASKLASDETDMSKYCVSNSVGYYKWNQVRADGYDGIFAMDSTHSNWISASGGWDVPTIAIWNPEGCVYDVKRFQNAGEWEYTPVLI